MPPRKLSPPADLNNEPPEQAAGEPEVEPQPPDPTIDPFETLFAPDAGGAVVVQLRRDWPDRLIDPKTGQEIKVSGYLEDLPPNIDSYEAYIQARYGGGNYLAQKKVGGRIRTQASIKIAGPSRFPSEANAQPAIPGSPAPKPLVADGPTMLVEGIPIPLSSSMPDMERMILFLKAIKMAFPEPPPPRDINDTLLAFALKGNAGPDMMKLVEQFTAVSEALRSMPAPSGDGGEMNWMGLIGKALEALPSLVAQGQNRYPTRPAPALAPIVARPSIGGHPGALPENIPDNQPFQPAKEESPMGTQITLKDQAAIAVANLVGLFLPEAPTPPDQAVQVLDNILRMDKESRAKLLSFKQMLWNMAKSQFCATYENGAEIVADFEVFFNEVFDEFVRADRQMLLLE